MIPTRNDPKMMPTRFQNDLYPIPKRSQNDPKAKKPQSMQMKCTSFLSFFQKKTRYVGFFLILLSFWPQVFLGSPEKLPEVQDVPEEQPYNIRELPEDPKFPSCDKDRLSVGGKVGVEARKMTTVTHLLAAIGQVVPGCAWLCQ